MDVPVVFLDGGGEREMNIGDVEINPTLEYKPFQIMLSHKMRISPNQISLHLLHRKPYPQPTDNNYDRRRNNGYKADLGLICRSNKERCFLVVIKRYRRSSRSADKLADFLSSERYLSLPPRMRLMPENIVMIRSSYECIELVDFFVERYLSLPPRMRMLPKNMVLLRRYHQVIIQNEYQMSMQGKANFDSGPAISNCCDDIAPANDGTIGKLLFCEECENAARDGNTTSFHPCVNDTVITCFTTTLGPIKKIAA
ncbi:hypothetical protein CASFOL_013569 [Castilleja foliolosa]|uniref:DUF7138 domain-containing protein n=1 Tax=Castilleja foliolosa TaxID=1961234 RepID=A0ABD3DNY6_9LAMI